MQHGNGDMIGRESSGSGSGNRKSPVLCTNNFSKVASLYLSPARWLGAPFSTEYNQCDTVPLRKLVGGSHSGVGTNRERRQGPRHMGTRKRMSYIAARRRISPKANSAGGSRYKSGGMVGRWVEGRMAAEALKNGM